MPVEKPANPSKTEQISSESPRRSGAVDFKSTPEKSQANSPAIRIPSGRTEKGRFQKGVSGNPSGRPCSAHIVDAIKEFLDEDVKVNGQSKKKLQVLIQQIADEKPEILLYFVAGKPVEIHKLEHTGADGGPIEINNAGPKDLLAEITRRGVVIPVTHRS